MIEKEYYRLDDLQHRFNMTLSDIKYLLEERKIPLCFHVRRQSFVVGLFRKFDFIGFCSVQYEGLVRVADQYINSVCENLKIKPERYFLLQRQKAKFLNSEYEWEQKWPNSYIQGWQPKWLSEIDSNILQAKLHPEYRTTPQWAAGMLVAIGANAIAKYKGFNQINEEELVKEAFEVEEKALYPDWLFFKLEDICIQHEHLESLGIMKSKGVIIEQSRTAPESINAPIPATQFKNQFEELIARILSEKRHIKPKEVHKLLCMESRQEEDCRHFDTENILYPETGGVISWRDKYRANAERSYVMNSVNNIISAVKKKLAQTGQLRN